MKKLIIVIFAFAFSHAYSQKATGPFLMYNKSATSVKVIPLTGFYMDFKKVYYSTSITLNPMQSVLLFKLDAPPLPNKIEWLRMNATATEFQWKSSEEDNLVKYMVEVSADGGRSWQIVGVKTAVGPSTYILKR